ncbi:MAG TPA: HAMP domain-containing sensor histidine kinase [Acidobacteriota bacterium]|nr:HAMP domain-containing sensor histidine kinase [Acidobacteriota bacterium]
MQLASYRKRKIFTLFLLGIGLPSIILGYLAFQGIRNDQAYLESRRLVEQRVAANKVVDSVRGPIHAAEQALSELLIEGSWDEEPIHGALGRLREQYPFIEEVVHFSSDQELRFLTEKLLFQPGKPRQFAGGEAAEKPRYLLEGERSEFQRHDYQRALGEYRRALNVVGNTQTKALLTHAIARTQTKIPAFNDAIETYQQITKTYDQARLAGDMPLGIVSRLKLAALLSQRSEFQAAAEILLNTYQLLIESKWVLTRAQYEFFVDETRSQLGEIVKGLSPGPAEIEEERLRQIESRETIRRNATERLLAMYARRADLQARANRELETLGRAPARFSIEAGGHDYLVSVLFPQEGAESKGEFWGLLYRPDDVKELLLKPALFEQVSQSSGSWFAKGREGAQLYGTEDSPRGSLALTVTFPENFPPWIIESYQPEVPLLKALVTSPRFYVFLLLAGILTFGLILTVRSVSHELELVRMKSDFVSTVSHEFKSPLTSIRQIAEMLQNQRVPSEDRRQRYFDVLVEQSERLSLLVGNILDFARMEEGKRNIEYEQVDISNLVQEIVSTTQERVQHEGYEIRLELQEALPTIQADRASLNQAIHNLLDNAVKYSAGKKEVVVRVYSDQEQLVVSVQDFGLGIDPQEIDRVFERFYRGGDQLTRAVRGSGLGLTLVKQIVEAHEGTVRVESEPGKGSTFSIWLPLKRKD